MTVQAVTVNLPKAIYERLQHVATAVNQPLEEIVFQSIQGNLPPALDDLPQDLRQPLLSLQTMSDQELWSIAKATVNPQQWSRHEDLLQKKQIVSLNTEEELELNGLRTAVDQLVFCQISHDRIYSAQIRRNEKGREDEKSLQSNAK